MKVQYWIIILLFVTLEIFILQDKLEKVWEPYTSYLTFGNYNILYHSKTKYIISPNILLP